MAGVVSTLPLPLHQWDPVVASGTGERHPLSLIRDSGPGWSTRSGAGSAFVLSMVSGPPVGARSTAGSGGSRQLALALGTGVGVRSAYDAFGFGAPIVLPLTRNRGVGIKTTSGFGANASRRLDYMTPAGARSTAGRGGLLLLPLAQTSGVGVKHAAGTGAPLLLRLALHRSGQPGVHREFAFVSPVEDDLVPLEPGHSRRLIGRVPYALTVWLDVLGWHVRLHPNPDRLAGAVRVYPGGVHFLTDDARTELVDAGFGDHVVLKEIR